MSIEKNGQIQVLNWRRLNVHSLLWHLGFYIEYIGVWWLARLTYRGLRALPGMSHGAMHYRSLAEAKLVPFGIVDKPLLEKSPHFSVVREISSAQNNAENTDSLLKTIADSMDVLEGVWSIADIAESANNREMSRVIYSFLAQIPPSKPEHFLYTALSLFRLGEREKSFQLLELGLSIYPDSEALKSNKRSLGLASGDIYRFLNISKHEHRTPENENALLEASAAYVAGENLAEFSMRLPAFLAQEPRLTDELTKKVLARVKKGIYVFPFIEYVLVTMVRAGVPLSTIQDFRKVMGFKSIYRRQKVERNRILDIATLANFSYAFELETGLESKWDKIAELNEKKIELSNPLAELPSWTPWVGAFVQAPRTPLRTTVSKLLPLVQSTWPIVNYIAPHTLEAADKSKRIKLGFLFHSSMPMISEMLPFFSSSEFETVFIYPKDDAQSKQAAKWLALADVAIEISDRNLEDSIYKVADLQLDFIISGPSTSQIWFVALARLARIQAILLEPAWTDGSLNLDYYISWRPAEPLNFAHEYHSAVALLEAPPYWIEANQFPLLKTEDEKRDVLSRLVSWNKDQRLYLCASTIIKLHSEMNQVILDILLADPGARVLFLRGEHLGGDALKSRLRESLGQHFERVIFLNSLPVIEAHALLQSVHCVFDSFPITGMSSSFDGLRLGVPIVTLESENSFGKWTSAIYKYLGISGLSTSSKTEFVAICIEIARNERHRNLLSRRILSGYDKVSSSEDGAKELVNFVKSAWSRYLDGQKPADWIDSRWNER